MNKQQRQLRLAAVVVAIWTCRRRSEQQTGPKRRREKSVAVSRKRSSNGTQARANSSSCCCSLASSIRIRGLIRTYSSSFTWSLKTRVYWHWPLFDISIWPLFMLYYIKGVDFIMKYVMFGFEKVKNDKLPDNFAYLMTFVTDLENVLLSLLLFFAIFYLLWFFCNLSWKRPKPERKYQRWFEKINFIKIIYHPEFTNSKRFVNYIIVKLGSILILNLFRYFLDLACSNRTNEHSRFLL